MKVFAIEYWALWIACGLLLVSCLINLHNRRMPVPNWLSLPSILSGWIASLTLVNSSILPSADGGLLSSFVATIISLLSLLPLYAIGGLGAGSVKMQMGFGAWAGCALPLGKATLLIGVAGVVCIAIIFVLAVLLAPAKPGNLQAEEVRPRVHLIPAQPVLAAGSIGTTIALSIMGLL